MLIQEKINEIKEWFKENQKIISLSLLIFLIATLSFGLGYLISRDNNRAPIIIEKCSSNFSVDKK